LATDLTLFFSPGLRTRLAHLLANSYYDLPGLASLGWLHESIVLGVEENEVVLVSNDFRISYNILFQTIPDTGIDHNFLTFASFLLLDPKSLFNKLKVIQEMVNMYPSKSEIRKAY
jgi:hypothetical protein